MSTKFQSNLIHTAASQFFNSKTEKSFCRLYEIAKPLVSHISFKFLHKEELVEDCVSEIFTKIYKTSMNPDFKFNEEKSYLSWLIQTTRNHSIILYNKMKANMEITESEFVGSDSEDIENFLEFICANQALGDVNLVSPEDMLNESVPFHENNNALVARSLEIIKEISSDEKDAELLEDILFRGYGREELLEYYGINSRITITSRRRRALKKMKEILLKDITTSKFLSREEATGEIVSYHKNGKISQSIEVKNSKFDGLYKTFFDNGKIKTCSTYKNGIKDGHFTEYFLSGQIKLMGNFKNGDKVGVWERFEMGGHYDEVVNYDDKTFSLYDEAGILEQTGILELA
jgi:RNA polymerase sigma factor (sigma-70 family)